MSKTQSRFILAALTTVIAAGWLVGTAAADTRVIPSSGTTSIRPAAFGLDGLQQPELRLGPDADEGGAIANRPRPGFKKGIFPKKPLDAPKVKTSSVAPSSPELNLSLEGLNHRDQRLANGGNQFSLEPPDQALCVGNGVTLEATNSVLRLYNSVGAAISGVQDLNTFFGYPAQINRANGQYGADVIDPVCMYDSGADRFIVAITTLHHVGTTSAYSGKNTIDLAVSDSGDPLGTWTIYHVPAQNDGTDGTPDHGCTLDGSAPGPCFQDYPHIGADANGVYVTTNEYDLFGPSYNAAQIFAFSKAQLAAHPAAIDMTLVENLDVDGSPGFTVWPAISNPDQYESDQHGTEYFLSTIAGDGSETGNPTGTARRIGIWALSNTESLNSASPSLTVDSRTIESQTYVFPPTADQKPGDIPLADCINDTTTPTVFGLGCWQLFFVGEPAHDEVESHLDSGDTRMQQVWYTDGMLWASSGTAVNVGKGKDGDVKAGIAWYAVEPKVKNKGKVEGKVKKQGYIALENNNLTYPAITMGANGKGAIAFTVVGADYYPSAGYATIDDKGKVGDIHIAAPGAGPSDGFTSYKAFVGDPPRTRWGDYGAAVTDGDSIWIASEYIAQTCSYSQYYPSPPSTAGFGSCGNTRTSLANWSTRISKITP